MGDVVISPAALSEQVYRPLLASAMLRGTVNRASNPPGTPFGASPASSTHVYSATHSASSRAPSTPTSSSAAPSYSSPSHDVPAYVQSSYSDHNDPSAAYPNTMSSSHRTPLPPSSHPAEAMPTPSNSMYHSAAEVAPPSAQMHAYSASHIPSPSSPRLHPTTASTKSLGSSVATSPSRIKVRDLSHIQSFASEELLEQAQRTRRPGRAPNDVVRQYEISAMPVTDIIEMVAGLLTKITATNDLQHENIHRQIPPIEGTAHLSPQASSVLAFHGKNVPSITILSYLTRIHKYCPTTYEVFLSLLVYFDRMTDLVNQRPIQRRRRRLDSASAMAVDSWPPSRNASSHRIAVVTPPSSSGIAAQDPQSPDSSITSSLRLDDDDEDDDFSNFFIVDSFNIHRLVIAGVTCASKFFSDVFYTNSRYAKVGGLPLVELNHLELQFLLLNDFRLSITVEELDAYGTMLVEFYAREVVAQQQQQAAMSAASVGRPLAMDHFGQEHRRHHRHSRDESEYSNHMRTPP